MTKNNKIFSIAKSKFEELSKTLKKKRLINDYKIEELNGIMLQLFRNPDNKEIIVKIDQNGEVFSSIFDNAYINVTSEYEEKGKLMAIDELLKRAQAMMENRNYYEEIYE